MKGEEDFTIVSRRRILKNFARGWSALQSDHPAAAILFFRQALLELQALMTSIEKRAEEKRDGARQKPRRIRKT